MIKTAEKVSERPEVDYLHDKKMKMKSHRSSGLNGFVFCHVF